MMALLDYNLPYRKVFKSLSSSFQFIIAVKINRTGKGKGQTWPTLSVKLLTQVKLLYLASLLKHKDQPLFHDFHSFSTRARVRTLTKHACLCSSSRNVVQILKQRGLLESLTSPDLTQPNHPPLKVYCGFDPTAESLHLGNLLGIIVLSWFLRCGHRVVALVGGATGRVGDPTGKSLKRPKLDPLSLEKNISFISCTLETILGREALLSSSPSFITVLNNYDWWKNMNFLDFLEDVAQFTHVGPMMSKEIIRERLKSEEGMNYAEFTYQPLQGYDFVHLFRNEGVNVQIGGSDQWDNIMAGTDLIHNILQKEGAYGLTFLLFLNRDGTKFGKSEGGAIWLSSSLLSPYEFYQYFFSISDANVVKFLRILTFLSLDEIQEIDNGMRAPGYVPNTAQQRLAGEVTRFVHGEGGLKEALKATQALRPGAVTKLDWKTVESIAEDVPSFSLRQDQVLGRLLVDVLVYIGLFESKGAAKRLLKQGGLYLSNNRVDSEGKKIEPDDVEGKVLLLPLGKKNKMIVRIS